MTKLLTKEDIDSCPFCGRKAILQSTTVRVKQSPEKHYGVHCLNTHCCGGRLGYFWKTESGAIRAWNKRPIKPTKNRGQDAEASEGT